MISDVTWSGFRGSLYFLCGVIAPALAHERSCFLWCMENFWRRALVEPVCIASKPSNSSSSFCCPPSPLPSPPHPLFSLASPALACKTHSKTCLTLLSKHLDIAATLDSLSAHQCYLFIHKKTETFRSRCRLEAHSTRHLV